MKKIQLSLFTIHFYIFAAIAGVPVEWSVDVTRVEPVRLDAYHGETLDLSATLMQGRRPLSVAAGSATFLWQTNGMGAAWWQTNATVSADGVVRGTFGPAMDTGSDSVRFFFSVFSGSGANYRASGTIALRASPGATPTTADLASQTVINFSNYQIVNAPWITAGDAAESVRAATNALATALQVSDNALSNAISVASRASTNYTDSVAADGNAALVAATNAIVARGVQRVATAAQAATNYTDAAVASISIPSLTGYATEAWVQGRGYLTDHQPLTGYATEDWTRQAISNALPVVPSLAGYATEAWVQGRGYLTSHQPLTGYATEAWVQGRGYLTGHQSLAGYATEEWTHQAISNALPVVPSLAGYATEAWVQGRGYLTDHQSLAGYATEAWVQGRGYLTDHQSLAGYATETYATDAATGAREAAEAYARNLAWAASSGSTRLVSLDGETWQDATGTVWRLSGVYGWRGTAIDLTTTTARPIQFNPVPASNNVWTAGGGTNLWFDSMSWILEVTNALTYADMGPTLSATNLSFVTTNEAYYLYYTLVALETNAVAHVMYSSGSSSAGEALRLATPDGHTWQDATGCVWRIEEVRVCTNANEAWTYTIGGTNYTAEQIVELYGGDDNYSMILYWDNSSFINSESESEDFEGWYALDGSGTAPVNYNFQTGIIPSYASDHFLAEVEYESYLGQTTATRGHMATVTNLVGRVAYTNDLPTTPSAVGAAPASIVPVLTSVSNDAATAKLNSETALRIVLGESVWFAVTNYMRTAQGVIPSLQLWEVRGGATNLVYDSREEITNTVRELTQELRADLTNQIHGVSNAIPSKAWGNYQSDGEDNPQPGEVAIVNQPTVILTGGGTFNKYIEVGDSSVWVLKSSGPVSFGGNTNGNFFAVLDDEGNAHFKVAKTDSYDLPAIVRDILPRQHMNSILLYTATTNRQGNAVPQPVLSAADDLKESAWHEEAEGEIDALGLTVSWAKDDTIPAWVATITPDVWHPKMFFRAKVLQEGGVAVINTAPTRFDGGVQFGNDPTAYRLVPYTTGGKTYLTLETTP